MELNVKDKTILGVAAHADDLDFGASGSVAKWVKQGAIISYLILTDGSKGYEDHTLENKKLIAKRKEEQRQAAKILGVKQVFFGNFTDGELINSLEVRKLIVKFIRQLKPDIVLTLDPTFIYDEESGFINHPDHRAAGQATLDSVFPFARNSRTFPEFMDQGLHPHIVQEVIMTNFKSNNFFVDIEDVMDIKLEAIKAHKSQYDDFSEIKQRVLKRAETVGKKVGVKLAEGFMRLVIPH